MEGPGCGSGLEDLPSLLKALESSLSTTDNQDGAVNLWAAGSSLPGQVLMPAGPTYYSPTVNQKGQSQAPHRHTCHLLERQMT